MDVAGSRIHDWHLQAQRYRFGNRIVEPSEQDEQPEGLVRRLRRAVRVRLIALDIGAPVR